MNIQHFNKGVSLYLALMLMTILLAIALGLSTIFLGQAKTIRGMGHSVIAFYAADTGIEAVLINREDPFSSPAALCTELAPCSLENEAKYYVDITTPCGADTFCIKSIGTYKETKRAIEITY